MKPPAALYSSDERRLYRLAKSGDPASINEIVQSNKGLVYTVAWKYVQPQNDIDDLFQCGMIGLLRAIEKFDLKRGCKFSTYATFWIRQGIGAFVMRTDHTIKLPARPVTKRPFCDSLDDLMNDEASDNSFADNMADASAALDEPMLKEDDRELVIWALDRIEVRLARILRMRHGFGGGAPRTLRGISRIMGMSAERIRQLEKRAVREIRLVLQRKAAGLPCKIKPLNLKQIGGSGAYLALRSAA